MRIHLTLSFHCMNTTECSLQYSRHHDKCRLELNAQRTRIAHVLLLLLLYARKALLCTTSAKLITQRSLLPQL
jgi:hypothetical protein